MLCVFFAYCMLQWNVSDHVFFAYVIHIFHVCYVYSLHIISKDRSVLGHCLLFGYRWPFLFYLSKAKRNLNANSICFDCLLILSIEDDGGKGLIKRRWELGWESQLSLSFDRQLSCTLINFELVQILMRVNERFGSFDRSWELHESRRELQKQEKKKKILLRIIDKWQLE